MSLVLGLDVSPRRSWSDDELETAKRMAREGYYASEIGAELGRSKNSVHLKLMRSGINMRSLKHLNEAISARFWRHVPDRPKDDCWIWAGTIQGNGYGGLWVRGNNKPAHRLSYELNVGPIGDGLVVCHSCDTPLCVNPEHLWLGYQQTTAETASPNLGTREESATVVAGNSHAGKLRKFALAISHAL